MDDIYKYEKKWKIPAPGHYNVVKSMKELEAEKKLMAVRKRNYQDKLNFLDDVQLRSTQTPGTGMYNPRVSILRCRIGSKLSTRNSGRSRRTGGRSMRNRPRRNLRNRQK